jgi:arylsulfatase A-like enzyme
MPPKKLNGAPEYGSPNTDWGPWPADERNTIDFHTANYCVNTMRKRAADRPLFLACGIFKPHSPFFAPLKYHETYSGMEKPVRHADDWDDLPSGAATLLRSKKWFWEGMMKLEAKTPGSYQRFIEAYAACCAFADAQIGRVLDALDETGRGDRTVIVLWSDHGFHLGEKDHIEKFALWEKSNHIPMIVVAPGMTEPGARCAVPVDLTVLYPTLLELCGLATDEACDGVSLVPLLENPQAKWDVPAVMTYMRGNHAVRSQRWRYIRYADGTEELYDHSVDPNEWTNVASDSRHSAVIEAHRRWLPENEVSPAPDMKKPR